MPISHSNQKLCCICGLDVTFIRRSRDLHGRFLCIDCAREVDHAREEAAAEEQEQEWLTIGGPEPVEHIAPRPIAPTLPPGYRHHRTADQQSQVVFWIVGTVIAAVIVGLVLLSSRG
jgi:hypothetical protein